LTEKLALVLAGPAPARPGPEALPPGTSRYEISLAERYPESSRYPTREGVTGVVLITAGHLDEGLLEAAARDSTLLGAYRLEERIQWDYERTWHEPRTPGMKQISFVRRKTGLTREEFAAHWNDVHAPLAVKHHPTISRYVQNVLISPLIDGSPEIDGVAELSYLAYEDWRDRKFDSDDGQAVITADIARFLEPGTAWHVLAHEYVLAESGG
jgi:uncharacterized protein (TIGR02118 family)